MKSTAEQIAVFSQRYGKNENGFVLILTMVMLAVLSVLGVMVLNSTETELKITSNSRMTSDAFVATELATEFAVQKIIDLPTVADGAVYDLSGDGDLDDILPDSIELIVNGNEIDTFTGQSPPGMDNSTSTDADQGNIYWTSGGSAGSTGSSAYYRVSVETRARGNSTARVETLFVNRGGQVF